MLGGWPSHPREASRSVADYKHRSTVQKNIFEWTRKVAGSTWRLALTAKATGPANANDKQRYAVVITMIEHATDAVAHQAIRSRLPASRVRVRVPVPR